MKTYQVRFANKTHLKIKGQRLMVCADSIAVADAAGLPIAVFPIQQLVGVFDEAMAQDHSVFGKESQ